MAFLASIYQALHEMSFPPATLLDSAALGDQVVLYGDLDGWNGREVQGGGAIRI